MYEGDDLLPDLADRAHRDFVRRVVDEDAKAWLFGGGPELVHAQRDLDVLACEPVGQQARREQQPNQLRSREISMADGLPSALGRHGDFHCVVLAQAWRRNQAVERVHDAEPGKRAADRWQHGAPLAWGWADTLSALRLAPGPRYPCGRDVGRIAMGLRFFAPERLVPTALGGLLGWHPIAEADTFWHLTLGRAVLRHASRVVPEPTALTAWSEPCVVPEWLWDLLTFQIYRFGGVATLSLLPCAFGALAGYLSALLLEAEAPQGSRVLRGAIAVLAMCALSDQLNVRPNLALAVLLLGFLLLAQAYTMAGSERAAHWHAAALVALAHLWAQLHASFVLAVVLFTLVVAPYRLRRDKRPPRAALRLDGLVIVGVLLTGFTCAHGVDIVELVLRHSGGDATRHITDMKPFDWTTLSPFGWPLGTALTILPFFGALPYLVGRGGVRSSSILLALLGAAMTYTAVRFAVEWVLLLLPLAAGGARALSLQHAGDARRLRGIELAFALIASSVAVWAFHRTDQELGPMLRIGVREAAFPSAAAQYLRRLPAGSPVFTAYWAGGPLGFWLDGYVRTFVDGRTPLRFDDTDYAVARDMLASEVRVRLGGHALRAPSSRRGARRDPLPAAGRALDRRGHRTPLHDIRTAREWPPRGARAVRTFLLE